MSETPVIPKDIIGMSTADLFDEITRLRSLLEDLVRAVEPFAEVAPLYQYGSTNSVIEARVRAIGRRLTVGDLRRAREAYLKAHSHTEKETG